MSVAKADAVLMGFTPKHKVLVDKLDSPLNLMFWLINSKYKTHFEKVFV
jgi:hypothetical protein